MTDYLRHPRRRAKSKGHRAWHPSAGRSAEGQRGECPVHRVGLMPGLEHDAPYCLACTTEPPQAEHHEDAPQADDTPTPTRHPTPRAYPVPMRSDLGHG